MAILFTWWLHCDHVGCIMIIWLHISYMALCWLHDSFMIATWWLHVGCSHLTWDPHFHHSSEEEQLHDVALHVVRNLPGTSALSTENDQYNTSNFFENYSSNIKNQEGQNIVDIPFQGPFCILICRSFKIKVKEIGNLTGILQHKFFYTKLYDSRSNSFMASLQQ